MQPDQCLATSKFPFPGQNLYELVNSGPDYFNFNTTVTTVIQAGWYAERKYANQTNIDSCYDFDE